MQRGFAGLVVVITVLLVGVVAGGVVYVSRIVSDKYLKGLQEQLAACQQQLPPPFVPSSIPTPEPPLQSTTDLPVIAAAVTNYALQTGNAKPRIEFFSNDGQYASGGIGQVGYGGGASWFAAKLNGRWIVVHVGQAPPRCLDVAQYNLPDTALKEWLHCYSE